MGFSKRSNICIVLYCITVEYINIIVTFYIPSISYICTQVCIRLGVLYGGKLWQWENLANSLQKVIGGIKFGEFAM